VTPSQKQLKIRMLSRKWNLVYEMGKKRWEREHPKNR
jgi:hypothetical protein